MNPSVLGSVCCSLPPWLLTPGLFCLWASVQPLELPCQLHWESWRWGKDKVGWSPPGQERGAGATSSLCLPSSPIWS